MGSLFRGRHFLVPLTTFPAIKSIQPPTDFPIKTSHAESEFVVQNPKKKKEKKVLVAGKNPSPTDLTVMALTAQNQSAVMASLKTLYLGDDDQLVAFDLSGMVDFLKGMLKPLAATAVVLMAVVLSFFQKLGLEGEMVYSILRAFLQLSVIGFVLELIFSQDFSGWIIVAYLFMVIVAGYTAGQRAKHVPRGKYVAGVSILAGTAITMVLLVLLQVFPFTPRYIIPVAGMMVGNAMTVTGVTMKRLRDDIRTQMNLVETALALGATPRQATVQQVKRALVIALSPVLDNAKTVGLISLPGAMTGMIMGGASPLEAIQLQIVVMNFLIGASTVSSIVSTYLCWPGFFTKAYQLETKVFFSE